MRPALFAFSIMIATPALAQNAEPDTALLAYAAGKARARTAVLVPAAPTGDARAQAQYREAMAELERGAWADAALSLQAVQQRVRNNPSIRGDLAYAQARAGQLDAAQDGYLAVAQQVGQNGWYLVCVALLRAGRGEIPEAAGTMELALQRDSSVVDARMAPVVAGWFESARDRSRSLAWSRMAVRVAPDDANSWLRIAAHQRQSGDSTGEGAAAIRRYRQLRPDETLGKALYALYVMEGGQLDTALTLAGEVATDTSFRPYAAEIYLRGGVQLLNRRDVDRALSVLRTGQPWATGEMRPVYAYYVGRAGIVKSASLLSDVDERRDCASASAADSMVKMTEQNLRDGVSYDSTRARTYLNDVLPSYRSNATRAVETFCRAPAPAAAPARRRRP